MLSSALSVTNELTVHNLADLFLTTTHLFLKNAHWKKSETLHHKIEFSGFPRSFYTLF